MNTKADELKAEIRRVYVQIAEAKQSIEKRLTAIELVRAHEDRLHARLVLLEAQLEREDAPLVKPQPPATVYDNWKV